MAKLYFFYGTMGSCKTVHALTTFFNYQERGMTPILLKPKIHQRDGSTVIKSRIGLERECTFVEDFLGKPPSSQAKYNVIIVDEAQFLSTDQVWQLANIVDALDIPVLCYGLRTSYTGELFEGSLALMSCADTIKEQKTMCWCGRKAIMNARLDENGNVVTEGNPIDPTNKYRYTVLCRKHWMENVPGDINSIIQVPD